MVHGLLLDPATRADAVLTELRADALAETSELLRSGLTGRLGRLAAAITETLPRPPADRSPLSAALGAVEHAWSGIEAHRLAEFDHRGPPFRAAVRLLRWLAVPDPDTEPSLATLLGRHKGEVKNRPAAAQFPNTRSEGD